MKNDKSTSGKKRKIKALIFDLDGVLTQTQHVHNRAWKATFDEFMQTISDEKVDRRPMTDDDYTIYVDGKPRYEGVKSFLESRNTSLPYGSPDDSPDMRTVCGLGNRKNELFNEFIKKGGVKQYHHAINKLKKWCKQGFKTAIVSSSKNCLQIIKQVGIADLFDTRVDGVISAKRKLKGKPNPDIFVEAANEINVAPEEAVVFEDAISGVQAGQQGHFGLVVGVDRTGNSEGLLANGADIIIKDFSEIDFDNNPELEEYFNLPKPQVFSEGSKVFDTLMEKEPVIFLDYDGTLTPIVSRPEDAFISEEMRETLKTLADVFRVAIITGRDTKDVQNFIKLDNLIYAGSHGYNISGPDGLFREHEKAEEIIPLLDKIEQELIDIFSGKTEGVQVERKRYAIAVHYRNAREQDIPVVYEEVAKMLKKYDGIKKGEGKKVVEIKPDLDWHKGKAVLWILKALNLADRDKYLPIFIGDDITDEDAFRTLKDDGLGILVGTHGQETAAQYSLKNVFQVKEFFQTLLANHDKKGGNDNE
jgi:trehalose-phosphatase